MLKTHFTLICLFYLITKTALAAPLATSIQIAKITDIYSADHFSAYLPEEHKRNKAAELSRQEVAIPFKLSEGNLFRATLITLSETERNSVTYPCNHI